MKLRLYQLFFLLSLLAHPLQSHTLERELDIKNCDDLMQWIYAELTEKNFDLLYKRTMHKFILGLYALEKDSKNKWVDEKVFRKLKNELFLVDPKAKKVFKQKIWPLPFLRDIPNNSSTNSLMTIWKDIQTNHPTIAAKIPSQFKLDNWDEMTLKMIDKVSSHVKPMTDFQLKLKSLHAQLNNQKNALVGKTENHIPINQLDELNQSFLQEVHDILEDSEYNFDNICPREKLFAKFNKVACSLVDTSSNNAELDIFLHDLEKYIQDTSELVSPPIEDVEQLDYPTNSGTDVTYCRRSTENIKYLVIHHTGTDASKTPLSINRDHVNDNNWYMVAYNYLISTSFKGASTDAPKVFSGRPPEMQGAHTGSKSLFLSKSDYESLKTKTQFCGNDQIGLSSQNMYEYSQELNDYGAKKGVSGNFFSMGIAIIGNYVPITYERVNGTLVPSNIYTEEYLKVTPQIIKKTAELSCKLQKNFPNIKTIVPHSFFKATDCPGELIEILGTIKEQANALGCEFKVELKQRREK